MRFRLTLRVSCLPSAKRSLALSLSPPDVHRMCLKLLGHLRSLCHCQQQHPKLFRAPVRPRERVGRMGLHMDMAEHIAIGCPACLLGGEV